MCVRRAGYVDLLNLFRGYTVPLGYGAANGALHLLWGAAVLGAAHHGHEAAAVGARQGHGLVPSGEVAFGVAAARVEDAALLALLLDDHALAALGAFDAQC